ncbi:MAG: phage tail tape measure protein [Bacillota bacterium]
MAVSWKSEAGKIIVEITTDNTGLEKGTKDAQDKTEKAAKQLQASAEKVGKALAAVGAAVTGALALAFKSAMDYAVNMERVSQITGVATNELSKLAYAGEQTEVPFETITQSLRIMARTMYDASNGSKETADAYALLGVSVTDANGNLRSANDVLMDVADRFSQMTNETQKAALAQKVFGRGGAELVPLLNAGREGLEKYGAEAERLGAVLTPKMTKSITDAESSIDRANAAFLGAKLAIGAALAPAVEAASNLFATFVGWLNRIPAPIRDTVIQTLAFAGGLALIVGGAVLLAVKILQLIDSIKKLSQAQAVFNAIAAMNPYIILAVALVAGVALIYNLVRAKQAEAAASKEVTKSTQDEAAAQKQLNEAKIEELQADQERTVKAKERALQRLEDAKGAYDEEVKAAQAALDKVVGLYGDQRTEWQKTVDSIIDGIRKERDEKIKAAEEACQKDIDKAEEAFQAVAAKYTDQRDDHQKLIDSIIQGINDQRDAEIQAVKDAAEETKQGYQDQLDAARKTYDDTVTAAREAHDKILNIANDKMDAEVSALQDQIDVIDKAEDERQRQGQRAEKVAAVESAKTEADKARAIADLAEWDRREALRLQKQKLQDQIDAARAGYEALRKSEDDKLKATEEAAKAVLKTAQDQYDADVEALKKSTDKKINGENGIVAFYKKKAEEALKDLTAADVIYDTDVANAKSALETKKTDLTQFYADKQAAATADLEAAKGIYDQAKAQAEEHFTAMTGLAVSVYDAEYNRQQRALRDTRQYYDDQLAALQEHNRDLEKEMQKQTTPPPPESTPATEPSTPSGPLGEGRSGYWEPIQRTNTRRYDSGGSVATDGYIFAHAGEWVLNRRQTLAMVGSGLGGGNVTFNFYGAQITSPQSARNLLQGAYNELKRNRKLRG